MTESKGKFTLDSIFSSEGATSSGKFLAWVILIMLFIDVRAFGIIPLKSLQFFRGIKYSDIIFLILLFYTLLKYSEIQHLTHKNILLNLLLVLEIYIFILLIVSSVTYKLNILEYFFRIMYCFKLLIVFPIFLLFVRNSIGYFIKLFTVFCFVFCIVYAIAAFRIIEAFEDVATIDYDIGSVKILRIYADSFLSEMIFLYFIFLFLLKKGKLVYFLYIVVFALPTILAFGRNAWFSIATSVLVITFLVSLKTRAFTKFLKIGVVLSISAIFFVIMLEYFIPKSSDHFYALGERFIEGFEEVKYEEGTYGYRLNYTIPALLSVWEKNPLTGIGIHPDWAFGTKFWSSAYADAMWPSFLAGYGLAGMTLLLLFLIKSALVTLKYIRIISPDSSSLFIPIITLVNLYVPLTSVYSLIPFNVYMTASFNMAFPFVIPVLLNALQNSGNDLYFIKNNAK